jgi:hypothetical protein
MWDCIHRALKGHGFSRAEKGRKYEGLCPLRDPRWLGKAFVKHAVRGETVLRIGRMSAIAHHCSFHPDNDRHMPTYEDLFDFSECFGKSGAN